HAGELANERQSLRGACHLGMEPFELSRFEPGLIGGSYFALHFRRRPVGRLLLENALDEQNAVVVVGQGLQVFFEILESPIGIGSIEKSCCRFQVISRGMGRSQRDAEYNEKE